MTAAPRALPADRQEQPRGDPCGGVGRASHPEPAPRRPLSPRRAPAIAADLFAVTLKAGGLLNGTPIGSTVGSLRRYERERRSFAKQIGEIADSLDLYCATPKKIREDAKANRVKDKREHRQRLAEFEKLIDAGSSVDQALDASAPTTLRQKGNVIYLHLQP